MKKLDNLVNSLEKNKDELEFVEERLGQISVKESYILEGALELNEIETAVDLINLTEQLYRFEYYHKARDEKSLGEYVGRHKENASDEVLKFIKLEKLGREYHEDYQGVFTDKGYVIQRGIIKQIYDGTNINELSQ